VSEQAKHRPIVLTVEAEMTFDPERGSNRMHFVVGDCAARICPSETESIGRVAGCIGGDIEIHDSRSGRSYTITPLDLWHSFQAAIDSEGAES